MDNPNATMRVVSVLDRGIDREKSDVARYAGYGDFKGLGTRDLSLIHPLPGAFLREVEIRSLKGGELAAVDACPSASVGGVLAFRWAVVEIHNAYGPGQSLRPSFMQRMPDGKDRRTWADDEFDRVIDEFGWQFVTEISSVILGRANEGKAWGGGANFTLPPSCTHVMTQANARLAALANATEAQERTERSASTT